MLARNLIPPEPDVRMTSLDLALLLQKALLELRYQMKLFGGVQPDGGTPQKFCQQL